MKAYWRAMSRGGLKLVRERNLPFAEVVALVKPLPGGVTWVAVIPGKGIELAQPVTGLNRTCRFDTQAEAKAWVEAEMGPRLREAGYEVDFEHVRPLPGRAKK